MATQLARLMTALEGRYRIEREIGHGGMGTVYLATDLNPLHERCVALKVLNPDGTRKLDRARFVREIRTLARLAHPHIVPLLDSGYVDGFFFCVMQYVEDPNLRQRLIEEKQLLIDDAVQIACEVADALSYAHAQGVIHRDVKPENIVIQAGRAVVTDFGIAKVVDGQHLTVEGTALGTPPYMSPEQAAGSKDLDGRSDLYSLGCVLYEMLAGERPFTASTTRALLAKHRNADRPSVRVVRKSVPDAVEAVVKRAMAIRVEERFETGTALAAALRLAWRQSRSQTLDDSTDTTAILR